MTTRIYNPTSKNWVQGSIRRWSATRNAWERVFGSPLPGMEFRSMFDPYIGKNTIWQRSVTAMPLDPNSAQKALWMWNNTPTAYKTVTGTASGAFGAKTTLNTSQANTHPIAACVVDSSEPDCRFQYMDTAVLPGASFVGEDAIIKGAIPWPSGFTPALNGDRGLAIYDLATGIMREWFMVNAVAGKPGHWTSSTGGYSIAKPHFQDLHLTNYPTQYVGSSAVVKMHNSMGFIGIDEVRKGKIDHAIAFTMANATGMNFPNVPASWPAINSDGKFPPATWSGWLENGGSAGAYPGDSPRHGQWGRLPASVNPWYNPRTGLPYNPLTRLIIKACQTYGMVGTDTNAWAHSFNTESGNREKAITGVDPWVPTTGELAKLLLPENPSQALDVSDFPWDLTEWAPVDWGRPNTDFMLRANESIVIGSNVPQTVRTNLSTNPRGMAGSGWRSNNGTAWSRETDIAITGHPQGITTAARFKPLVAGSTAVASMYAPDGLDTNPLAVDSRSIGFWVYSNRSGTVTTYSQGDQPGTTQVTNVAANTWVWCTSRKAGTGMYTVQFTATSVAIVGTDYVLMTGSIAVTGDTPPAYFFDGRLKSQPAYPFLQATYAWTGAVNLSTSTETVPAHVKHY